MLLWGTALAGFAAIANAGSAAGLQLQGIGGRTLSPRAQHTLRVVLAVSSPYVQQLVLRAVRALGPERAEAQLAQVGPVPPAVLQQEAQLVAQILQALPRQYHQVFIDGLFQVSAPEEQFVAGIAYYIQQRVAGQSQATEMISQWGHRMRTLTMGNFQASEATRAALAQGGMQALGAPTQYVDDYGRQAEGYTASVGVPTYICLGSGAQLVAVPGPNGPPSWGCTLAHTP
jgi:hypothetical protein